MDPIKILFDEHDIILDAIQTAKNLRKIIHKQETYAQQVFALISFFRAYADKYHHYKEEEVLFPEMAKANEMLESGVIQEMLENHEDFRELIREIELLTRNNQLDEAQDKLEQYVEALTDHIAVENDEVFEIAKTIFSEKEMEKLYFRFKDLDAELGDKRKTELTQQLLLIKKSIEMLG